MDAKTKKGVDKIIRLSYNKCRWFKQTGEMAEWFMALVLKTSDTVRYRGFESLSLRHFFVANFIAIGHAEVPKRPKGLPC